MKSDTMAKHDRNMHKTGNQTPEPFTESEQMIIDYLFKVDSAAIEGTSFCITYSHLVTV